MSAILELQTTPESGDDLIIEELTFGTVMSRPGGPQGIICVYTDGTLECAGCTSPSAATGGPICACVDTDPCMGPCDECFFCGE